MPKGFPIGFEMAEKKPYKPTHTQTDRHFRISRDNKMKKTETQFNNNYQQSLRDSESAY